MTITVEQIKAVRERTGAGIMECKKALEEADGDPDRAIESLKARGAAEVAKRVQRETREGLIEAYIHNGNRIGALVELNCETDFVSRTSEFRELVHLLAMQVAAMAPVYVDRLEVPHEDARSPEEVCLLQQPFIKDPGRTVQDLITDLSARVGEQLRVRRFVRFALGE